MKRKDKLPELLAPAGDFECLIAAVRGGADAVYLGGKSFGARAYAKNFDMDELERAIAYCHLHGVRLYVAVNTLLFDGELSEAASFCAEIWKMGVDAIIIADLGLVSILKREIPEIELHASTQMSVHNVAGADLAYELGCSRVVLARELSRENIAATVERCRAEVEIFVHGALCVCHSGQCLFSSLVGGRSGNRGECAQPCRLPWGGADKHPLSLCDLSLADHIREICDTGAASLKIEGRMKSPEYVYTVTSTYRLLLDEYREASAEENRHLARAFSRGGFTDGYFVGELYKRKMTGIRSDADKEQSRLMEGGSFTPDKVRVKADAEILRSKPASLTLTDSRGRQVTVFGDTPSEAINAPLTEESVCARICKMGGTFLELCREDVRVTLDEGLNLSPAAINSLRREAVAALERLSYEGRRGAPISVSPVKAPAPPPVRTALFFDPKVYESAIKTGGVSDYFNICFLPLWRMDEISAPGEDFGIYIPPVIPEDEWTEVDDMIGRATALGAKYALIGNLSHLSIAKAHGLVPIGDFRLNITNTHTAALWHTLGIDYLIASAEVGLGAARDVGGAIVHGRIPLMLTERCFIKENFGCDRCSRTSLTDRKGVAFPMIREWRHRNIILNSAVTYMADRAEELRRAHLGISHFILTDESVRDISSVISGYKSARPLPKGVPFRRMGKRQTDKK